MKNRYEIRGSETTIFLTYKGVSLEALIDTEDLALVDRLPGTWVPRWSRTSKTFYVDGRTSKGPKGANVFTYFILHRLIMKTPDEQEVDHGNHNGLDNRKANLMNVFKSKNMLNRRGAKQNSLTGIRGVTFDKNRGMWRARVSVNSGDGFLGRFSSPEAASQAVQKRLSELGIAA